MYLQQQMHALEQPPVLLAGRHEIDAGRVDAAVAQDIGELRDVLFQFIKRPGKELSQIVRKHLVRAYLCHRAQAFHSGPDVAAVQGPAAARAKQDAACNAAAARVAQKALLELAGDENFAGLVFCRPR